MDSIVEHSCKVQFTAVMVGSGQWLLQAVDYNDSRKLVKGITVDHQFDMNSKAKLEKWVSKTFTNPHNVQITTEEDKNRLLKHRTKS